MRWTMRKSLGALIGAAIATLLAAAPALAVPVLSLSFDQPTGSAGANDVILMQATLVNDVSSDTLTFDATGSGFQAGGVDYTWTLQLVSGGFFPDYSVNFGPLGQTEQEIFANLVLDPGNVFQFVFANLTPPGGGATPGAYAIGGASFLILTPTFPDVDASNGFARNVVPEPGTLGLLTAGLMGLAGFDRRRTRGRL